MSTKQRSDWIKENNRCWHCARNHRTSKCDLKKKCSACYGRHLNILCEFNKKPANVHLVTPSNTLYLDRPSLSNSVLLKVVKVIIQRGQRSLETYAILDDGSERTILLHSAAQHLQLAGEPEKMSLRTVRQEVETIYGSRVSLSVSPASNPDHTFTVKNVFTAEMLSLSDHTYPTESALQRYKHLQGIPVPTFRRVYPLLLIGSDNPYLVTPVEPIRWGPPGTPAAIKTQLGWTLQGPVIYHDLPANVVQCLFTSSSSSELLQHVQRLWQLDTLPPVNEKVITRSQQDKWAMSLLETSTVRINANGANRYATPLLRVKEFPEFSVHPEAVMPRLRSTELRLLKDAARAKKYNAEIDKLEQAGYVKKTLL